MAQGKFNCYIYYWVTCPRITPITISDLFIFQKINDPLICLSHMKAKGKVKQKEKAVLAFADDAFDGCLSEDLIELGVIPPK